MATADAPTGYRARAKVFLGSLGPGVISGAADDDPSGIGTYSVAGAQFGTSLLWTAIITWPLMASVQMMCARIGMVTGHGLAANLRKKIPRWILFVVCFALFAANTLNIGADLSAMADAVEMLTGLSSHIFVVLFGGLIAVATIRLRYAQIAGVLKWLALVLFAYIATTFIIGPDWSQAFKDTFLPSLPRGAAAWSMVVAILGTTISPYLFFWQTSQEVEEEKASGRHSICLRRGATPKELRVRKFDVAIGTFFSNIVMYFIILAAALTLNKHGITNIETSTDAALALKPLAGSLATLLYAAGLVGTGLLAIPTLTGSAAYALAETFGWHQGLDAPMMKAKAFYCVIIVSSVFGIAFDFMDLSPVRALYGSAIVNGVLAPFLLVGILLVACDRKLMKDQQSSLLGRVTVGVTAILMFGAIIAMLLL